jgi:4-amino-4-deoxy-L-arabinose transferase-like glycosyltransferase
MKNLLRDLRILLPVSLVLGLVLSLSGPGTWWIGWLAYAVVFLLGLLALTVLWRSAGASRSLALMLLLALFLRLGLGIFFSTILPIYGEDTPVFKAGFAVRDASTYDAQAWKLASSSEPLWRAFDRSYGADDQYGGLLFFHSLFYRYLSPDAHRPWLLILFSALAGAIGVALAWKGANQSWGKGIAMVVGWIMALYPESLLVGASPVRESFLILFITMAFWGAVDWLATRHRTSWIWMAGSLLGMALFSPGVVVIALLGLGVWAWLREKERQISWWWVGGVAVVITLAALLLGEVVGGALQVPGGPLANLVNWLHYSASYGANITELNSGQLQYLFGSLPKPLHFPFIIGYGIAQPVLPAAIADPAIWPMRTLGILRGLGWYALLPFLLYGLRSTFKTADKRERLAWLWMWVISWAWIIISAARAGGDQWDNPRYRVILILFQAAITAQAVMWQRATHDQWLTRVLAVEAVFLGLFGYWYISRYSQLIPMVFSIFNVFTSIAVISVVILFGGWLWDLLRKNKNKADSPK